MENGNGQATSVHYGFNANAKKANGRRKGTPHPEKNLLLVLCGCVCFGDCDSCFAEKKEDDILLRGMQPTILHQLCRSPLLPRHRLHCIWLPWSGTEQSRGKAASERESTCPFPSSSQC